LTDHNDNTVDLEIQTRQNEKMHIQTLD